MNYVQAFVVLTGLRVVGWWFALLAARNMGRDWEVDA